jgi:hypothetical protein
MVPPASVPELTPDPLHQPSTETEEYWLGVWRPGAEDHCEDDDELVVENIEDLLKTTLGKWLVYVERPNVDEVWAKVARLVEACELGPSAKVSTARPNSNSDGPPDRHLICVYAEDWRDTADLARILAALRRAGLAQGATHFKRDRETWIGAYNVRGNRGVCVWNTRPAEVGDVALSTKWLTGKSIVVTEANRADIVEAIEGSDAEALRSRREAVVTRRAERRS